MPSGCLRLHGAEGDSAGFPHPGHSPEGDQGGKGLARCPGGQAGSRAAAGAPPLPHRPPSLPSSPRRPPECPQAAPASAGGVESLVPRPCSSGTSLSKVCVQRLPAPSGEQHLEGRLGWGGVVQGPDFWKSRAPCSRGCRAVCIAGTARSPLRRRPRCPRKQQPLPLAVQRPGWGWSAGLVLAVELSLPYREGREVQAPAPLGPSGDSEPRPVPRGASCRAGAQRLPAPVPTPAPSACAPASPGPGQRVSGRRAHRRVPPTPCLCRRLCRVPRAAGRVLAAALGAAGNPAPVAGHLEAAARRVHSAL